MDVVDVNDEAPYFPFSEYTATVAEGTQRGQPVASVKAFDDDSSSQVGITHYLMQDWSNQKQELGVLFAFIESSSVTVTGKRSVQWH